MSEKTKDGENKPRFKLEYVDQLAGIVKDFRGEQGLDRWHMGGLCGLSDGTISKIESGGSPNLETLIKLVAGMDRTPQSILSEMARRARSIRPSA